MSAITMPDESAASNALEPDSATSQTGVASVSCESCLGLVGFDTSKTRSPGGPSATNRVLPASRIVTAGPAIVRLANVTAEFGLVTLSTTSLLSLVPTNNVFPESTRALVGKAWDALSTGFAGLVTSTVFRLSDSPSVPS